MFTQGQLAVFYIIYYASFHVSKSMITLVLNENELLFLEID